MKEPPGTYTVIRYRLTGQMSNLFCQQVVLGESELTGATNLMNYYGLEHSYSKFSGKKVKEQLSSFLSILPGVIDGPGQSVSMPRVLGYVQALKLSN